MANNKHFIVTNKNGDKRLIQAKNKNAALAHVIGSEYTCELAKTTDVVDMFTNGAQLEIAMDEPKPAKGAEPDEQGGASG